MKKSNSSYSYFISFLLHLVLGIGLFFINFSAELEEEEYVTIGFGAYGKSSSAPKRTVKKEVVKQPEKKKQEPKKEKDKVEVPKTVNNDDSNVIKEVKKEIKKEEPKKKEEENKEEEANEELSEDGINAGDFSFDWGGKNIRKIYDYQLPRYPEGVSKEIDVKLRFNIKPDGTVGSILPLIKADTRLEMAAMDALKKWRFEPIPSHKKQVTQKVIIIFPFRLK
ncbi:MAG: TonB family protein [Melioribacteraceae bacterium]|nr:TonB family protein [Melioribacteraceae bacterium]